MVSRYNRALTGATKLQSSLGREEEIYKEKASSLVMAEVMKVNYIYNTVDVVTIKYRERLIKDTESHGQFSARLPVNFGGSLTNGLTYGQVIPINVGDQVLIGFLGEDKSAPIVLGIYKSSATSYELAQTDTVSGSPESPENYNDAFTHFTLFPSQTYKAIEGDGTVEATFPGESFLKLTSGMTGNGRLNDYGYSYKELKHRKLRGRDVEPYIQATPQLLFQHTGANSRYYNNIFMDENGDFRLSHTNKANDARVDLQFYNDDELKLRYQGDSKEANDPDSKDWSQIGVKSGQAYMETPNHKLSLDDNDGLLIDGKHVSEWDNGQSGTISDNIKELSEAIDLLQEQIKGYTESEFKDMKSDLDAIKNQLNTQIIPEFNNLEDIGNKADSAVASANEARRVADYVAKTVSDAAGTDSSLLDRLNRMEGDVSSYANVVQEVYNARKYTLGGLTYQSLGARLDDIQQKMLAVIDLVSDYMETKQRIEKLEKEYKILSDDFYALRDKLDVFLSGNFDKGMNSYIATITPSDSTTFRNGEGEVTLQAKLYKIGFDWTGMLKDSAFIWTRVSNNSTADAEWNANHSTGSKSLKVTAKDFGFTATFKVSVTVNGNLKGDD